jgi:hypothetical protein
MPRKQQPDVQPSAMDMLDPAPAQRDGPAEAPPRRPRRTIGPVERGVRHDLKGLPDDLRKGGIAAGVIQLAIMMDLHVLDPRNQSGHAREIRQAITTLKEMSPGNQKGDQTDDLRARREQRLSGTG